MTKHLRRSEHIQSASRLESLIDANGNAPLAEIVLPTRSGVTSGIQDKRPSTGVSLRKIRFGKILAAGDQSRYAYDVLATGALDSYRLISSRGAAGLVANELNAGLQGKCGGRRCIWFGTGT